MAAREVVMVRMKSKQMLSFMGNMTMRDLAKATGFNEHTVHRWFKTRRMSIEAVFLCAYVLGAEPEQLGDLRKYREDLESLKPARALNAKQVLV